eukprot:scaffold1987_cov145-Amphora_coffeaeformis.AAC.2
MADLTVYAESLIATVARAFYEDEALTANTRKNQNATSPDKRESHFGPFQAMLGDYVARGYGETSAIACQALARYPAVPDG